ncbi:MAG: tol-pal system YbgF family protein [Planctomycetota bacterium]|jgi:tetratricopeptide (TPR) repeat protein
MGKMYLAALLMVLSGVRVCAAQRHVVDLEKRETITKWEFDSDIHIFDFKHTKLKIGGRKNIFKIDCPQEGIWVTGYEGELPEGVGERYFHIVTDGRVADGFYRPSIPVSAKDFKKDSAWELLNTAYTADDVGNYDKALELYISFYSKYPRHTSSAYAMFAAGQILCIQKKYEESIALHSALVKLYPKSKIAEHALFRIACVTAGHLNKKGEAIKMFSNFIKLNPKSELADDALFCVAALHLIEDKTSQAIKEFALTVKMFPTGNRAGPAKRCLLELSKSKKY